LFRSYTLEREIGRGGAAVVYRAHDRRHDRDVAIKFLLQGVSAHLRSERFLREIRLTAQLTHPHILPLHDSGAAGDLLYYVMPYIAGETMRGRLARERTLQVAEATRLHREVAEALEYAQRRRIVLRVYMHEHIQLHEGHVL